ncbi:hypothetical protein K503DRAFT_870510 [Rhizopogon vinicolor AM-OR11-026]|uniref:DUF6533 domain-containing protein n=1 Tax=Rhizopogon vinicolor AM-OR11-026 TaxID=1314800 RepID=A0A1B7MGK0_9AGAM|nr:hypothetical protein K503DRAFT_870510 [Rhizopogon vinicolor AM-OR11-026]
MATVADALALQTVKNTNVAAAGLLVFDYCITFGDEIRWTLRRRWGVPAVMFILSRYAPFIGATMTAYSGVRSQLFYTEVTQCTTFNDVSNAAHFIGIIGSEGLLLFRIYVFWGCSRKFLAVMLPFSLVAIILAVVLDTAPISFGTPGVSQLCVLEGSRTSTLPYGVLLLYELGAWLVKISYLPSENNSNIVLMALTIFKRYRKYQNLHGSVVKALYRDGVMYMLCITLISIANVVVIAALPVSYSELLNTPQIVIHSVLASRILFNLQDATEVRMQETNHLSLSSPYFERPSGIEAVDV